MLILSAKLLNANLMGSKLKQKSLIEKLCLKAIFAQISETTIFIQFLVHICDSRSDGKICLYKIFLFQEKLDSKDQ